MEDIISKIKSVAGSNAVCDNEDFLVFEASGSNVDDAFELGRGQGEIDFARLLLRMYDARVVG